ncbi:MAG: hypothetical protein GY720_18515 [bacterium]|nr:hypothetical protein [bacterium]
MPSHPSRTWLVVVVLGVGAVVLSACGGSSTSNGGQVATTEPVAVTTTLPPQAQLAPRTSPPPKVSTTLTTTTSMVPRPVGFPVGLKLPAGEVGYYTGSPALGFHLNVSTEEDFSDLVRFFTTTIAETGSWDMSVRDVGRGFLPGFENQWAIYTANDHVLTQLTGADYQGVLEIEDRHINILLDPLSQPEEGQVPAVLPGEDVLPLPEGTIRLAGYSAGLVHLTYDSPAGAFEALVATYREREWVELGAIDTIAVGELAGWKITVELLPDGPMSLEFENLALSYP